VKISASAQKIGMQFFVRGRS